MNWYGLIKLAQIWKSEYNTDDSFVDQLEALYELEYKYFMLKSKPFRGMPQRKENILNQLRQRLNQLALEIREPILITFQSWLSSHALLEPGTWADSRVSNALYNNYDGSISSVMNDILHEYNNYSGILETPIEITFSDFMQEITRNSDKFPFFKEFLSVLTPDYQANLEYNLESEGYEEFGETYGMDFASDEDGKAYIQNLTIDDIGIDTIIDGLELNNFNTFTSQLGSWRDFADSVLSEFYENFVFPLWYTYWGSRGIDETRQNIEFIYNNLLKADVNDIENFIVYINAALNGVHQTGSMLQYLQEYIDQNPDEYNTWGEEVDLKDTFDRLSLEPDIQKWNKELKEIGVKI